MTRNVHSILTAIFIFTPCKRLKNSNFQAIFSNFINGTFLFTPLKRYFLYFFIITISHTLLDALTDGGLGVALFWPVVKRRYFFPWQPIRVSPIGTRFFSLRGMQTLISEAVYIGIPSIFLWLWSTIRYRRNRNIIETEIIN